MRELAGALSDVTTYTVVRVAIVVGLGVLFSWLFHREKEMTSFARRLGASKEEAQAAWPSVFRRSLVPTLSFFTSTHTPPQALKPGSHFGSATHAPAWHA